jgi:2'-5' RNA ligase
MLKSGESWRVFIAIELAAKVRKKIKDHVDRLRAACPDVRASWALEGNLHLTLKFLGDIPVEKVETLSKAAQRAASNASSFELIIEGAGSFAPRGQPRVLWIGIEDPSGKLTGLHAALEEECAHAGFAREQRPFHPHLTIARLRQPQGARQLAAMHKEIGFESETVSVSAIAVIRSELRSEGSRHTIVARHDLVQAVNQSY